MQLLLRAIGQVRVTLALVAKETFIYFMPVEMPIKITRLQT